MYQNINIIAFCILDFMFNFQHVYINLLLFIRQIHSSNCYILSRALVQ